MISSAVVNRYANALVDVVLSPESGIKPPEAVAQLRSFDSAVALSSDLRNVMASPAIPAARKRAIVKDIAEKLGLSTVMRNFVLVVSDHGRAAALAQIRDAFELALDERLGFVRADVRSASELNGKQQRELEDKLGKLAGSPVRVRFAVDPNLIGGVTARIKSTVYDGSLRGQLADMRTRLTLIR